MSIIRKINSAAVRICLILLLLWTGLGGAAEAYAYPVAVIPLPAVRQDRKSRTDQRKRTGREKRTEQENRTDREEPGELVFAGAVWEQLVEAARQQEEITASALPEEIGESRLIAHTGLCGKATQNSLLAFQLAGQAGYYAIETDVRWSSDRVLVCYHDEKVDRYTEGSGFVEQLSWEELSALRVGASNSEICGPQPIALFSEYLDTCKEYGCHALIDLKWCDTGWKDMVRAICAMVEEKEMTDLAIFQCSLDFYLETVRSLIPDAVCWYLCGEGNAEKEETIRMAAARLGCQGVNVPVISEVTVKLAHEAGMKCVYYVTDQTDVQRRCFELGYDLVMENGWD